METAEKIEKLRKSNLVLTKSLVILENNIQSLTVSMNCIRAAVAVLLNPKDPKGTLELMLRTEAEQKRLNPAAQEAAQFVAIFGSLKKGNLGQA